MALMLTHPDYVDFAGTNISAEEYPFRYYEEMLSYVKTRYKEQYWQPVPCEVARYFKHFLKNTINCLSNPSMA
jgi:hypothetical protein